MIKKLITLISIVTLFASCKKDSGTCTAAESPLVATSGEISALQTYCTANVPGAIQHSSGIFYTVQAQGSGSSANLCSNVTVKYAGFVLGSSTSFETNTTGASFSLSGVIVGWQKGVPLIQKGGSITLYIPPSLAYGSTPVRDRNGVIIIPANSYLKFTIDLVDIQ